MSTMSVAEKLRLQKEKAAKDLKDAEDKKKAEASKAEVEKEECEFCGKSFSDLKKHKKTCKENPDIKVEKKVEAVQPVSIDENSPAIKSIFEKFERMLAVNKKSSDDKIDALDVRARDLAIGRKDVDIKIADIAVIKEKVGLIATEHAVLKDKFEKKKPSSPSSVFTELMQHCVNSNNPIFKSLYEKSTDSKRHWRAIIISTIDALFDMGLI